MVEGTKGGEVKEEKKGRGAKSVEWNDEQDQTTGEKTHSLLAF